jgi:hypothetical protein
MTAVVGDSAWGCDRSARVVGVVAGFHGPGVAAVDGAGSAVVNRVRPGCRGGAALRGPVR